MGDAATGTGGRIRIFSGIQPTGAKHLGNLIGGGAPVRRGQERGESIYCLVDLHAITVPHDPEALRRQVHDTVSILIAAGARPGPMHPVPAERRRRARLPVLAAGQRHRVRRAEPDDAVQGEVRGPEGLRLRRPVLLPGAAGGGHPRVPDATRCRWGGPEAAHRACPNGRRALQLALRRPVHRPRHRIPEVGARILDLRTRTRRCPRPAGRSRGRSSSSTRRGGRPQVQVGGHGLRPGDHAGARQARDLEPDRDRGRRARRHAPRTSNASTPTTGYARFKDDVGAAVAGYLRPIQDAYGSDPIGRGAARVDPARGAAKARAIAAKTVETAADRMGLGPRPRAG